MCNACDKLDELASILMHIEWNNLDLRIKIKSSPLLCLVLISVQYLPKFCMFYPQTYLFESWTSCLDQLLYIGTSELHSVPMLNIKNNVLKVFWKLTTVHKHLYGTWEYFREINFLVNKSIFSCLFVITFV